MAAELARSCDWLACFHYFFNHLCIIKGHFYLHAQEKQTDACFSWY